MKSSKTLVVLGVAILVFALSSLAVGQEKATPQEIVNKVQQAASTLAKSAEAKPGEASLTQFNQKDSPWVWKDSYIFVLDCSKPALAAHPIKPELIGKDVTTMKDTKGNAFFGQLCDATKKPSGVWVEYWWPKPGATEGSRKISYALKAGNTPFVVGAGIYDDNISIQQLEKLTTK
ncbi:MAG TPA: cache domain-containing protein [Terriglobales bacterium]|jgi:signal transduction histidine kinase|nr:cache domain-containing protein [Terriglobales bacterium]